MKTLGRPDKAGQPLSGVTIRAKGSHNTVLSDSQGMFSLPLNGKHNGDTYSLQQVQKNGYELNEANIIGKQQVFSDKVPLTLVMVSTEVLEAEKRRIESNAFRTAERNYKSKTELLENQLKDSLITMLQYREQLADLQNKFEKYQSLIEGLAEHYAHTDYDFLNETDREINLCIENGDLERADSLINTLFDPIGVLQRNMQALAGIEQQIGQARGIIEQANTDMATVLKQQEKDAEYLYQLYTIALSRYDNDKALFYIETRTALDTTNVGWMMDAAEFVYKYFAKYDEALSYNQKIIALANESQDYQSVARAYYNIGNIYCSLADYDNTMIHLDSALTITQRHFGEDNLLTSAVYSKKGDVYLRLNQFDKAGEHLNKALSITSSLYGEDSPETGTDLCNLGALFQQLGDFGKALEYYNKAIANLKKDEKKHAFSLADAYENIGSVYSHLEGFRKALEYKKLAFSIKSQLLGTNHPAIAHLYHNIGVSFGSLLEHDSALYYYSKALNIKKNIFGENHPQTIMTYTAIGGEYCVMKDFEKSKAYLLDALEKLENTIGVNNDIAANILKYLCDISIEERRFDDAIQYTQRLMNYYKNTFGEGHPQFAIAYCSLGDIYEAMGDHQKAFDNYSQSYNILIRVFPENHPAVLLLKGNMESARAKINPQSPQE